jgi:hypothetical protein
MVNSLEETFENQNVGIAYIYCVYREQTSPSELVASLLKQLIQHRPVVSKNILDLYKYHRRKQTRPPLTDYLRVLFSEVRHFSRVFILIDALDECSEEQRTRDLFLSEVLKLVPLVSVLVTSRDEPNKKIGFQDEPALVIHATEEDVRRYLETRLEKELSNFVRKGSPLWAEIVDTIVKMSHGMFVEVHLIVFLIAYSNLGFYLLSYTWTRLGAKILEKESEKHSRNSQKK